MPRTQRYMYIQEHTFIHPLVYIQNAQITCDCGQMSAPVTSMSKTQIIQMAGMAMNSLFSQNFSHSIPALLSWFFPINIFSIFKNALKIILPF